ncbi:flagellar basal body-associated FliL family protein [Azospirillum sp. RWY-5-1]|uniref:Flagellar basal body-associated FliL family protein n=1 Tax=Azospirillum oleiclasticum TaxID=2735135 RepID=A0ABX2TMF5_9PROT|nr:flagellar basal body-associated FliL family protein [Azospirillum oleiclasticum]NYZ17439.1 flagellar basal body-associated FliL family protein [Azospirillum oleiclasticum]NYZ24816.1 flagellar basal body-associated FliL family protein [Azospirillum oleiclasticum]
MMRQPMRAAPPLHPLPTSEHRDPVGFLVIVFSVLLALTLLGGGYVAWHAPRWAVEARMGPAPPYALLPDMSLTLGEGRVVDLRVRVEMAKRSDLPAVNARADRIADRLVDRMAELEPADLQGVEGAGRVKRAVEAAVERELRGTTVRKVLVDVMIVR